MTEDSVDGGENTNPEATTETGQSKKTPLRFLINKRSISLQGILERMFEN